MPQKDPEAYKEYQKRYKRRLRAGELADDRDQLLELLRSKDEHIARLLSIIERLTGDRQDSVNLLSIPQARDEAEIDRDRQDSVNLLSISNGRIDKDRQNLSIPEEGLTENRQSFVNPESTKNPETTRFSRNGSSRDRQKIDTPFKEGDVDEEDIKTNNINIIDNNKNAGAQRAPAQASAPASAQAGERAHTIARLRDGANGVKASTDAPRIYGKCPYEEMLGEADLRLFTETVQKRFPDINGMTFTVKQLRHAYQQVGDVTKQELRSGLKEYFRAMDATIKGKGITSIDGWSRTTLATAISDAKLASEYAGKTP